MKKWNLHTSPTHMYEKQPKTNKFKQRHFILTKSDKQYVYARDLVYQCNPSFIGRTTIGFTCKI